MHAHVHVHVNAQVQAIWPELDLYAGVKVKV